MAPVTKDEHAAGGLGRYVVCAAAFHVALFALSSLRTARASASAEVAPVDVSPLNVDAEPASHDPPATPPGGGSPVAAPPTIVTPRSPVSRARPEPRPAASPPVPVVEPPRADQTIPDEPKSDGEDEERALAAVRADNDRRERAMATAWFGLGPGSGGGPGGAGAGFGAPAIRGRNPFGNGSHGALTGRVCFLPFGTMRIADVRSCQYVATLYTDTLDIPERQFVEGFPGVTNRSEWFLIDYTGKFSVAGYGTYVFRLHSDDGSYLYIDDALVIENDGKHAPESRIGRVQLAVGEHQIKVRYAQTNDRMALQLFVRAPGAPEAIFTTQL